MLRFVFNTLLTLFLLGLVAVAGVVVYLLPGLPAIDTLDDMQLQVPLRVYTRNGAAIEEFGEQRRSPVTRAEVPEVLIQAFLAAEDDRFYEHPGVDWQSILRAAVQLVRTGEKSQGGSTITMQVARNYFLSREKTYLRKVNEILLALKMERELHKDEILELYLNKIFLGHRAYGVAAAAQVYYGTDLDHLTLAQAAVIAGLPKAPSRINPITDPQRALERRGYVLGRMLAQRFITDATYQQTMQMPITAEWHGFKPEVEAPYVAEMVRNYMSERYGEDFTSVGYRVFTTIDGRLQQAAQAALRENLLAYDRSHGWRGPEHHYDLDETATVDEWQQLLRGFRTLGGLLPALVVSMQEQSVQVYTQAHGVVIIPWSGLKWARPYINPNRRGQPPKLASAVVEVGDVVRIRKVFVPAPTDQAETQPTEVANAPPTSQVQWQIAQLPDVESALVSLNPDDGSIFALVGGFDFARSKFNRVTQAQRQPGSNFKPFIYSAALASGSTAATFINDSPIVQDQPGLQGEWRPENFGGKFLGPTRLREALKKSRNLVSIRLLDQVGIEPTLEYVQRFGFERDRLPRALSLALGSGEITPLELIAGYAVLANGGYRITPFFVDRVESASGEVLYQHNPERACPNCTIDADIEEPDTIEDLQALTAAAPERKLAPRVIEPEVAWIMNSILRDVIRGGTGARAYRELQRPDLGGKTGTTNDFRDAWFSGFNRRIVTTAWVGADETRSLGKKATGASAALPMWIDFMRHALAGMPESYLQRPDGVVSVRIDPERGCLAGAGDRAIEESFRLENVPTPCQRIPERPGEPTTVPQQLF